MGTHVVVWAALIRCVEYFWALFCWTKKDHCIDRYRSYSSCTHPVTKSELNKTHCSNMHCTLNVYLFSLNSHVHISSQWRAPVPPWRQTPVSTIRQRFLTSCPAFRLPALSRADQVYRNHVRPTRVAQSLNSRAVPTLLEDRETRHLCSLYETCLCVFRRRGIPGGRICYTQITST